MNHLKFEVKKSPTNPTWYGVWNHDMKAFQYVFEWDGLVTPSKRLADKKCDELNDQHLNAL